MAPSASMLVGLDLFHGCYQNVKAWTRKSLAYENICFSLLFTVGDVSCKGMSATPQQKFHTDDVKSVWNPVRSADWLADKRQKATKIKGKRK